MPNNAMSAGLTTADNVQVRHPHDCPVCGHLTYTWRVCPVCAETLPKPAAPPVGRRIIPEECFG